MNVRSPAGERRHRQRQYERQRAQRWSRAWAHLDDPISLVLDTHGADRVPVMFLTLPRLKTRIQELNVALDLARSPCNRPASNRGAPKAIVHPAAPRVAKQRDSLQLDEFQRLHERGSREYDVLVRRGEIAPGAGDGWALLRHDDLTAALPAMKLTGGRQRARYFVQVLRGDGDRAAAIRVFSTNYAPIIERRICPPAPG